MSAWVYESQNELIESFVSGRDTFVSFADKSIIFVEVVSVSFRQTSQASDLNSDIRALLASNVHEN